MFDDPVSKGIIMGGARRAMSANNNLNNALDEANATIDEANRIIAVKNAEIRRLSAEVNDFRVQAIQKLAHAEGYKAMFDSMKNAHPNSPMLMDSGKRYKSGNVKTKANLLYEIAFDGVIRSHQTGNPTEFRAD